MSLLEKALQEGNYKLAALTIVWVSRHYDLGLPRFRQHGLPRYARNDERKKDAKTVQ